MANSAKRIRLENPLIMATAALDANATTAGAPSAGAGAMASTLYAGDFKNVASRAPVRVNDQPQKSVETDVNKWLDDLELSAYTQKFKEAGYDNLCYCAEITLDDALLIPGMKQPHARRIVNAAANLKRFQYPAASASAHAATGDTKTKKLTLAPFSERFPGKPKPLQLPHDTILLDEKIQYSMRVIAEELHQCDDDTTRVPPLVIASMARSGKTTLLKSLFNKLLSTKVFPIFINFNGNSNFKRIGDESDVGAFLRLVAKALLPPGKKKKNEHYSCDRDTLEAYLKTAGEVPIVLLVDELNALAKTISRDLAQVLREMFLSKGRYLVFTTHWFLNLEDVAGKASPAPSPRGYHFVSPPTTRSVEQINKLIGSIFQKRETLVDHSVMKASGASPSTTPPSTGYHVTEAQVASHMGSVGLLVSVFGTEQYTTLSRFKAVQADAMHNINRDAVAPDTEASVATFFSGLLEGFLEEFCVGTRINNNMAYFDQLTTRMPTSLNLVSRLVSSSAMSSGVNEHRIGAIMWPLCFAKIFLAAANKTDIVTLINHTQSIIGAPIRATGLQWEYVVRCAIGIVGLRSTFGNINSTQKTVLGLPDRAVHNLKFKVLPVPKDISDPGDARVHLREALNTDTKSSDYPLLVLAYPLCPSFTDFDTITCFKQHKEGKFTWRGQQMKRGKKTPSADPPFNGVLIRGKIDGDSTETQPVKRQNWKYLGGNGVKEFLPLSLHPLLPDRWDGDE